MTENLEYYRNQILIARTEIKNLRQQLASLKHEHLKDIQLIKTSLNKLSCGNCREEARTVNPTTNNGDHQNQSESSNCITYKPIGVIETVFQNKRGVPRQTSILAAAQGTLVIDNAVFNNPEHALEGLAEFSHMWIMFHFHATDSSSTPAKVSPPRLQGARRGVFATRAPHRPCPIGLSLVKIVKIEGNKVHFQGVDMVNGTPVLDIKPYIPQYDYPSAQCGDAVMSSVIRPPTEGISDATEGVTSLALADDSNNRLSPRLAHALDAGSPRTQSPYEDIPTGDGSNLITPTSPSPDSPSSVDLIDRSNPLRRPDTERGSPDGQERFTPPQSTQPVNVDGIRVAPWVSHPPSRTFQVRFTDDALARLGELIGDRAQAFRSTIERLLAEDPRSQYVRTRYPDHEYSCVLEDLSVSCVFDSGSSVCTIVIVRSADELQQA